MKKGANEITNQGEICYKLFKKWQITDFGKKKTRPNTSPIISQTKCDRDKPIGFAERGG